MGRLPVSPQAIRKLLSDFEGTGGSHVLAVGGATDLASELRQQFLRGRAAPEAVRLGGPEGADAYVHVLAGEPADADVVVLRRARLAHVPVIAVVRGPARREAAIPYVLATDVVRVGAGEGFPLETIARVLAARLGERGAPLAAGVPLLRGPVCEHLVESFSRRNGLAAAAVGADLPVLALNQVRLVLRLAQAHGWNGLGERGPELAVTVGAALGLRALARELLDLAPAARWAVRGGIAYGGTRILGNAARLRFGPTARPPRAAASPVSP
ncbi:MAG TPA: hypothetical protein VGH46_02850 [Gaiellaceae bacterium]